MFLKKNNIFFGVLYEKVQNLGELLVSLFITPQCAAVPRFVIIAQG
jgi:hypothetical protein